MSNPSSLSKNTHDTISATFLSKHNFVANDKDLLTSSPPWQREKKIQKKIFDSEPKAPSPPPSLIQVFADCSDWLEEEGTVGSADCETARDRGRKNKRLQTKQAGFTNWELSIQSLKVLFGLIGENRSLGVHLLSKSLSETKTSIRPFLEGIQLTEFHRWKIFMLCFATCIVLRCLTEKKWLNKLSVQQTGTEQQIANWGAIHQPKLMGQTKGNMYPFSVFPLISSSIFVCAACVSCVFFSSGGFERGSS